MKRVLSLTIMLAFAATGFSQATLKYEVPKGWVAQSTSSSMRVGQFALPKASRDAEDAELVIFFFRGQGGGVEANLQRWMNQMAQPDGRSSREVAKTSDLIANGLKVTVLDVTGTYVAEINPGSPERHNKPNFRMKAAVVETPGGPYFVKLTGPQKTVAHWDESFNAFLKSVRFQ